jgi:hypothetical protein
MQIKPGGRNGWFCFARSSSPVVGMAGFANHKYRLTVSRSQARVRSGEIMYHACTVGAFLRQSFWAGLEGW